MLIGERVRLRELRKTDIEAVKTYINDPEITRMLRSGIPFPLLEHEEEKWINSQSGLSTKSYSFAIETLDNQEFIGECGFTEIDWKNRHTDIGIFLGKDDHRGKGLGTEVLRLLVEFGFNELNLNKIKLGVFSYNKNAIKCYEKFGFITEGIFKDDLFRDGMYHNVIYMALFKKDFI